MQDSIQHFMRPIIQGVAEWHEASHETKHRNAADFHQLPLEENRVGFCPASIDIKAGLFVLGHDAHKTSESHPHTTHQTQAQN